MEDKEFSNVHQQTNTITIQEHYSRGLMCAILMCYVTGATSWDTAHPVAQSWTPETTLAACNSVYFSSNRTKPHVSYAQGLDPA